MELHPMSHSHIMLNAQPDTCNFYADLQLQNTNLLGIFGHSAAGKTLLLRSIAGLESKILGQVVINNQVWQDTPRRIFLPAHMRSVGYVYQEPRLLPHLNAKKNLDFALKRAGINSKVNYNTILQIMEITDFLKRYPHQLSGGQQQRVAIARAVLSNPAILLMDEPLSALDMHLKNDIIVMIKKLTENLKISVLYVSHDYSEIMKLADHITFVQHGSFSPVLAINQIYQHHSSTFLYEQDVPNIVLGQIRSPSATQMIVDTELGELLTENFGGFKTGQNIRVMLHPRDIGLCENISESKEKNIFPATIQYVETNRKPFTIILLSVGPARLICHLPPDKFFTSNLRVGMNVPIIIKKITIMNS